MADNQLPELSSVLVVCAHPDDESFGLGAVVRTLADRGTEIAVLSFTHGEASTLHGVEGELAAIRAAELAAAGEHLGVGRILLLDHPDGALAAEPPEQLRDEVVDAATEVAAEGLLVFDLGGVTGHPDHHAATEAALAAAAVLDLPVIAWTLPASIAEALNDELRTSFVGRPDDAGHVALDVDRTAQLDAIDCHLSQSRDNPALRRRLELQGSTEWLRTLR